MAPLELQVCFAQYHPAVYVHALLRYNSNILGTNMILAETEIRERSLQQTVESGRKEIEAIWCKYGKVY